jgi:hypothetical protein
MRIRPLPGQTSWAVAKSDGTIVTLCASRDEAADFIGDSRSLELVKVRRFPSFELTRTRP